MDKNELFDKYIDDLFELIVETNDYEACERVITAIMSQPETETIAQRLAAAKMLLEGEPYSEISKRTDISPYILANVHSMLKENGVTYSDVTVDYSDEDSKYTSFAEVYDKLTGDVNYKKRVSYIEKLFKKFGTKPQLVLDLACGTGSITKIMSDKGYDMIGIDGSPDMLNIAKSKSDDDSILYLCQQMPEFELFGTVDAVLCLLDSINYVTEKEDVLQTFKLVHNYLNPGGLFIFDVNTPYKLKNVLAGNTFCGEGDGVFYTWENVYDPEEKLSEFKLEFFIQNGEMYERKTEFHYERAYSDREIKGMLKKAGLTLLAVYDDLTFDGPSPHSEKIFYIAKKEN